MGLAMRCCRLLPLLLAAAAFAGDEAERVRGRVVLRDGTELSGDVRTTAGKPLRLVEAGTGRRLDFSLREIHRIVVHVLSEEQARVWRWVEDGSREKVMTGESYPKRDVETEVVLRNGQVHFGDLVAVLYVYPEGAAKPAKVILRKQDQGEIGETLADLGGVESVEFEGPLDDDDGAAAGIRLVVSPGDLLRTAHAIPRERDRAIEAVRGPGSGVALFRRLPPATYDLAVVTEERIFLHLGVGEEGAPLDEETLREVAARVAEIPDFFEVREALCGVREGDRLRVVVRKSREGPTSMGGLRTFRRFELWAMHRGGDRWLVDHRNYLWRDHGEALPEPPVVVLTGALGPFELVSGTLEVGFEIPREEVR